MEFHGKLNFLKSGIVFADEVNTVSPGYRDEILTPEFGFGLEGILQEKGPHLTGILNGVDYRLWNPETDTLIEANFGPDDLSGKALCKADLQKIARLPIRSDVPIIAMVSRLSNQKGIDILDGAIPSLMEHDVQLVLLGTGEAKYHTAFREFAESYPDKMGVFLSYDYGLAHKIFAGADMLMVPSRYEPCGLNQLYAMKYGTIPIVRATGGLTDTVDEFNLERDSGTGFKFKESAPSVLEETVLRAVDIFMKRPGTWQRVMVRGMNRDFSWKRSAMEYVQLYEKAIADRKNFLKG
jgi:starch synthase